MIMSYFKNLAKIFFLVLFIMMIFIFLNTLLYYFDIISFHFYSILKFINPIFSFMIGSFLLGRKASKKGWLEGLKLGGIFLLLFFIITSILKNHITIRFVIYDLLLLLSAMLGGMIGINKKKEKHLH